MAYKLGKQRNFPDENTDMPLLSMWQRAAIGNVTITLERKAVVGSVQVTIQGILILIEVESIYENYGTKRSVNVQLSLNLGHKNTERISEVEIRQVPDREAMHAQVDMRVGFQVANLSAIGTFNGIRFDTKCESKGSMSNSIEYSDIICIYQGNTITVGDSLTYADLYLAEHVAIHSEWFPEMLVKFPEFKSHAEKLFQKGQLPLQSVAELPQWRAGVHLSLTSSRSSVSSICGGVA
ncbi:hypothetical protein ANCCEY_03193 [Ancylostoma ceylanicum]|uniref:Glutathione S-transferase C-terminal domain-containing protein n=1 Tax=Ancylostoma ceylanicum TaxID=53326 RepID=A0A0D6M0S1_9BILA|nr:hypothetical protein ANCCEY_03193 [Ancylostoma ceylanicum]